MQLKNKSGLGSLGLSSRRAKLLHSKKRGKTGASKGKGRRMAHSINGNNDIKKEVRIPMRDYVDIRIGELRDAQDKSEKSLNCRLELLNEFRNSMKDQSSQFVTRTESDLKHEAMLKDINVLREIAAEAKGKASQGAVLIGYLLNLITLAIALIGIFGGK